MSANPSAYRLWILAWNMRALLEALAVGRSLDKQIIENVTLGINNFVQGLRTHGRIELGYFCYHKKNNFGKEYE